MRTSEQADMSHGEGGGHENTAVGGCVTMAHREGK